MAFRMTRPTIQGTEYHKASVLKAKAETVAQTRTAADPTLVATGSELGRSYIPKAIDFTIKPTEIKIPEGDGKKKEGQSLDERLKKAEQGGQTEEQYYNDMMDQILEKVPKKKKVQDKEYISPEPNQEDIDYAEELKRRSEELSAKSKQGDLDNSTRLDSIPIRPLPTKVAQEKLLEGTGSVNNYIYQQGLFEKAAEEFGYDISTPEGYKAAQEAMEYSAIPEQMSQVTAEVLLRAKEGWQKPGVRKEEIKPGTILTPEQQRQADIDAENKAAVDKMMAEQMAEIDAREAQKLQEALDKAAALQEIKDQEAERIRIHNEEVVARNEARHEEYDAALEFYNIPEGGGITQTQLDEYRDMIKSQAETEVKLQELTNVEEQNDREWNQAPPGQETVSNRSDLQKGGKYMDVDNDGTPDFIQKPTQVEPDVKPTTTTTSQTTQNVTNTKPKLSDFKDGKNAFGGHMSKNQAYNEAMKKWRRENPNPIQMRDDAIYKNAIKDGIVQKNMIKSGYKPLD
jgi:hypothetical protein